ncbi:MAG: hypothetical protein QOC66_2042 [Pseudonocardiales bacterium]|jgi:signal transduction histidine kinase|nr:hypothetical protein [Pseudonocardiales bacterium]
MTASERVREHGRREVSPPETTVHLGGDDCSARGFLHDLQQPITTLALLVSVAETSPHLADHDRAQFELIGQQARAAQDLISAALTVVNSYESPERGRLAGVAAQPIALSEEVSVILHPLQTLHGRRLSYDAEESPMVSMDRVSLRRIVENLLNNALRASAPHGPVQVTVTRVGGEAKLTVDDSGPGFGRIRTGAGIGLLASISSVIGSSGKVQLEQSTLGGARVSILLPTGVS